MHYCLHTNPLKYPPSTEGENKLWLFMFTRPKRLASSKVAQIK